MKKTIVVFVLIMAGAMYSHSASADVLSLALRLGGDVRPLLGYNANADGTEFEHIGDGRLFGLHVAPGLSFFETITAEVDFGFLFGSYRPTPSELEHFDFYMSLGGRLNISILYARLALPLKFVGGVEYGVEGALGLSLFDLIYVGALINYWDEGIFMVGLEAGVAF